MNCINLSFYKFAEIPVDWLPELRVSLLADCVALDLKGTILLAAEGLNCFIAGNPESIAEIKSLIETIPGMTELPYKESISDEQPFTRMLVKIKKEIITMGRPDVKPSEFTGPRVTPSELKQWIDEKRDVVILDTRNDYEVRLGTFQNALAMDLKTFRQFPERIKELPEELKDKTIVSFCTGGIRCEKASALLLKEGFKNVYQLDGGILRYFEDIGETHYQGECFVFDHRVALDPALRETQTVLCYNCQNPVTAEEQRSPAYVPEAHCPHCKDRPKEHKELIARSLAGPELA